MTKALKSEFGLLTCLLLSCRILIEAVVICIILRRIRLYTGPERASI